MCTPRVHKKFSFKRINCTIPVYRLCLLIPPSVDLVHSERGICRGLRTLIV